jgi:hypothetical protein
MDFVLVGVAKQLFKRLCSCTLPLPVYESSSCSISSSTPDIVCVFHFSHSVGVKWFYIMGLVCIVLMVNEVEYPLLNLLAIYIPSFMMYLYHVWARPNVYLLSRNCGVYSFFCE